VPELSDQAWNRLWERQYAMEVEWPLKLRANRLGSRPPIITREEVARLLEEAGAPKPRARPERCVVLAVQMTAHAREIFLRGMRPAPISPSYQVRAQAAIDELRICLPELMGGMRQVPREFLPEGVQVLSDQLITQLHWLNSALVDVHPRQNACSDPDNRDAKNWHSRAAFLFNAYCDVVGGVRGIKNRPALRFVQGALPVLDPGDRQTHQLPTI
jgi:hypothetical protein